MLPSFAASTDEQVTVLDRLKMCDPNIAFVAAEEIANSTIPVQDPSQLFLVAEVLFDHGEREQAVFWYWIGLLRGRYQSGIPTDDMADFSAVLTRGSALPINNYALQDTRRFDLILTRALEWDRDHPNPFRDKYGSTDGLARIEGMYRSLENLRARLGAQREEIEQKARAAAPNVLEARAAHKRTCRKELVSRAQAERVIDLEKELVVEFIRSQPDVIGAVGTAFRGYVGSYTLDDADQLLPSRYEVTVRGNAVAFAIVDVSRNAGKAAFSLACITRTSLGQREPFKDPCRQ